MVQLDNVTKTHDSGQAKVHALRGVSFGIEAGMFTFIVGPSGSGKSTLLYLIGALDEPSSGRIIVDNRHIGDLTRKERDEYRRNQIGFIFQNFNLLGNLDAVDNVLVPYLPQGISADLRARAIELLKGVGLGDRLQHRPNQLSGGEQQRVAIARALLKRPALVLADEPTGELDTQSGQEVIQYLRRLQQESNTTVVIVTHDQSLIGAGDCTLRLRDGRIAEE